jgi:hypothetical protein
MESTAPFEVTLQPHEVSMQLYRRLCSVILAKRRACVVAASLFHRAHVVHVLTDCDVLGTTEFASSGRGQWLFWSHCWYAVGRVLSLFVI